MISIIRLGDFNEVYYQCSLAACEPRDVKGPYKKARAGEISDFTGISAPCVAPLLPEVAVNTAEEDLHACVESMMVINNLSRLPCNGVGAKRGK